MLFTNCIFNFIALTISSNHTRLPLSVAQLLPAVLKDGSPQYR